MTPLSTVSLNLSFISYHNWTYHQIPPNSPHKDSLHLKLTSVSWKKIPQFTFRISTLFNSLFFKEKRKCESLAICRCLHDFASLHELYCSPHKFTPFSLECPRRQQLSSRKFTHLLWAHIGMYICMFVCCWKIYAMSNYAPGPLAKARKLYGLTLGETSCKYGILGILNYGLHSSYAHTHIHGHICEFIRHLWTKIFMWFCMCTCVYVCVCVCDKWILCVASVYIFRISYGLKLSNGRAQFTLTAICWANANWLTKTAFGFVFVFSFLLH